MDQSQFTSLDVGQPGDEADPALKSLDNLASNSVDIPPKGSSKKSRKKNHASHASNASLLQAPYLNSSSDYPIDQKQLKSMLNMEMIMGRKPQRKKNGSILGST